jgi:hypothetical protein
MSFIALAKLSAITLSLCRLSARMWAELHEKAFRRLGGCARVVVLNNFERRRTAFRRLSPSIRCFEVSTHTMVWWRCHAGSKIRIARLMFHPTSLVAVLKLLSTICPPRAASPCPRMRLRSVCPRKGARRSPPVGTIVCEASAALPGTGLVRTA